MVIVTHTSVYLEPGSKVICPNFYNAQRLVMSMIDDFVKVVHIVSNQRQQRLIQNAMFSMTPVQKARFHVEPFILDSSRDSVLRALSLQSTKDKFRGVVIDEFMYEGKYCDWMDLQRLG